MKNFTGYLKSKFGDNYILLAGGGTKKVSDFKQFWPTWDQVTNKPDTATRWPKWSEVTDKPSSFTPSSHTHNYMPWNNVSSLNANDASPGWYNSEASITNAAHTNHSSLLYVNNVGTPYQLQIPDSSVLYIYKRWYTSGAWSAWSKISAGYADNADYADNAGAINWLGNSNAKSGTEKDSWTGLRLYGVYSGLGGDGYPISYGNVLRVNGWGCGELLLGWNGNNATAHLYYHSRRDNQETGWGNWVTIIDSSNIGDYISSGGVDTGRFTITYNSSNYGDSSSVTANDMVSYGGSNSTTGMFYSSTDNPTGSSSWCHVWSQSWSINSSSNWVSQIALGTQQGTGMWYRCTDGNIAGRSWTRVIDSSNIGSQSVSYASRAGYIAGDLCMNNGSNEGNYGISLYRSGFVYCYGIKFTQTSNWGTHSYYSYGVSGDWATYFTMDSTAHRGWIFRTDGVGNVASISNDGHLTLTSNGITCVIGSLNNEWVHFENNSGVQYYFDNNVQANGHFYEYSDLRLKNIISGIKYRLEDLAKIPLIAFEWKDNPGKVNLGTIAQNVQAIIPEIVNEKEYLSLDYGVLGTISGVTACKEIMKLKKEIADLKIKLKQLTK